MRLFRMNFSQTRLRLVQAGVALAATALVAGCGNNYRPAVTSVTSTGPAAQPESFAAVISAPSSTTAGIATIVDYAGDSILVQRSVGVGPTAFTSDVSGVNGYILNSNGTINGFPISSTLQEKQITYTTLASTAKPVNLFSSSSGLWVADLCGTNSTSSVCESVADYFSGSPETFLRSVPVASTPVMVVAAGSSSQRIFGISQKISSTTPTGVECNSPTTGPVGAATGIEISSDTADLPITVGQCPVYAVESSDGARLFVLNRGSDTISVINTQNGTLDQCSGLVSQSGRAVTCHPTLPLSRTAVTATKITPTNGTVGMTTIAGPVYAEYNIAQSLLVVANYDGSTISIIDVSLDEYGNDSATFGTTYTVPVGKNPASVTVLYDGSRAYTANQTDGTVSIVNLSSHSVEKAALAVVGHPRTVVSTQNSSYGKVYVASPDSNVLTIIGTGGTDPDTVDTTVLVEGNIVDVRVSSQNGSSGNSNIVSRVPGYGQPCNLPLSDFAPTTSINLTLANCQVQDKTLLK
jgi:DNA-binding beta-propeller fold protein YncE